MKTITFTYEELKLLAPKPEDESNPFWYADMVPVKAASMIHKLNSMGYLVEVTHTTMLPRALVRMIGKQQVADVIVPELDPKYTLTMRGWRGDNPQPRIAGGDKYERYLEQFAGMPTVIGWSPHPLMNKHPTGYKLIDLYQGRMALALDYVDYTAGA